MWRSYFSRSVLALAAAAPLHAQTFPTKPLRIITGEPGASLDFSARLIARALAGNLGQQVIVENRGGAGGVLAAQSAARALPDGHTMLFYGSVLWTAPLLEKLPYDPVRDFAPITLATVQPNILVVHPSMPVGSVKELIAMAKARPGEINFATGQLGSTNHLAALLFKSMAGIDIVHIPYKGTGPALPDLMAGRVKMMFPNAGAVTEHVKSGRLKVLAITSARTSALAPDLPTVSATGLPGYESIAAQGIFAPAGTPQEIINRLNRELLVVLGTAEIKDRFFATGVEVSGSSPNEFSAMIRSDIERLGKVIRDAGIRAE